MLAAAWAVGLRKSPQRAASSLGGSRPVGYYGYGYAEKQFPTEAQVPEALASELMPLLSDTGRLFVREARDTELLPARYDGDPPWDFVLRLRRRQDGAGSELSGHLRRGDESAELSAPLFLISLKAGGLGLNLTAADYVFILDPWWNPAVEAQAIDRAHRIGQDKHVFVYRLLCRDSVEEKVAALQEEKRDLAASIINADGSLIQKLDRETLELLLT